MRTLLLSTTLALCLFFSPAFATSPPAAGPALKPTDVFTLNNGILHLDGKPYAEISFNKFDLFWAIWDQRDNPEKWNAAAARQESALRDLHAMGFRTIRIFGAPWGINAPMWQDETLRAKWLEALDVVMDLCEKYQIQMVFSLGLEGFATGGTDTATSPAYASADSPERALCYRYIDTVVQRYRHRKAIAMWEISNELTNMADIWVRQWGLTPTLPQIADFFDATARRIKQNDPLRLVSNGGSTLRPAAWHLWHERSWTPDSLGQHKEAYAAFFAKSAVDVVDTHYYEIRSNGLKIGPDADGKERILRMPDYIRIVRELGKGAIFAEFGVVPSGWENGNNGKPADPEWFEGFHDAKAKEWVDKALAMILEAQPQIVYWWAYQSDRPVDIRANPVTYSLETTPELIKTIAAANAKLKAMWK